MNKSMRSLSAAAAAMAVVAMVSSSDGAGFKYEELPVVVLQAPPTKKDVPKRIAASSKIDGLFASRPKPRRRQYGPKGFVEASLFVNAKDAKLFSEDKLDRWLGRPQDESATGTSTACFNVLNDWHLNNDRGSWPMSAEQWPQIRGVIKGTEAAKYSPGLAKPRAFRIERLQLEGEKATLHMQHGWFDPLTLGAKQTAKYKLRYKRVADGPSGVQVFAARAKSGETVELVVYQPLVEKKLFSSVGRHLSVRRSNESGNADCGHMLLSLRVAPGTGEHGAVEVPVLLPEEAKSKSKAKAKSKAKRGGAPDRDDTQADEQGREIRIRTLVVHVGVSQGLKQKLPTTTVAFGWRGPVRRQRIF